MFKRAEFVSIDIETKNLTLDQIEFEGGLLKPNPSTKDEEKKKQQIEVKKARLVEKGACTNSAEIACVGICFQDKEPFVIHTFPGQYKIDGVIDERCSSTRSMLEYVTSILNAVCDIDTTIIVAGSGFDLPKLRLACVTNRCIMPEILLPDSPNPIYDVLYYGGKYFMVGQGKQYNISLDELLIRLGLLKDKKVVSGREIPKMIEEERFEEVVMYNGNDALMNVEAYLMMNGMYR